MLNYFYHPSNMRNKDNILDLRINEHAAGYGIYMMILELLRDQPNYKIAYKPAHIAFAINEPDGELIKRVCEKYNLFTIDEDNNLSSPWLIEALAALEDKRAKLKEAGKNGAAKRWSKDSSSNNVSSEEDNHPIATPSNNIGGGNNHPMANNSYIDNNNNINKQTNHKSGLWQVADGVSISLDMIDKACRASGEIVTPGCPEVEAYVSDEEHNRHAIAEIAVYFKLTVVQTRMLMHITQHGLIGGRETKELIKLYNKCRQDGFTAKYPCNYIMSNFSGYKEVAGGK